MSGRDVIISCVIISKVCVIISKVILQIKGLPLHVQFLHCSSSWPSFEYTHGSIVQSSWSFTIHVPHQRQMNNEWRWLCFRSWNPQFVRLRQGTRLGVLSPFACWSEIQRDLLLEVAGRWFPNLFPNLSPCIVESLSISFLGRHAPGLIASWPYSLYIWIRFAECAW